jgi:dipeptidyl aminopeptidase/acylaminoacyl peptidase
LWQAESAAATGRGQDLVAAAYSRQAFFCYRVADFCLTENTPQKLESYEASLRSFDSATRGLIQRIDVPLGDGRLPGYVAGGDLPAGSPGVLLIYGADGNKEEHLFATAAVLASRGVRTLVVDGPGQGHTVRVDELGCRPDWEVVASACLDAFISSTSVDPGRIALVGSSFGGYLAPRAFVREPRFVACALLSALYDARAGLFDFYPPIQPQLQYNLQLPTLDGAREAYRAFNLDAVADELAAETRPVLIAHGGDDIYIPVSQAEQLHAAFGANSELWIWPGANHNLSNVAEQAMPAFWQWVIDRLAVACPRPA